MVIRYLAAFGPAGVTDIQMRLGLNKFKAALENQEPETLTIEPFAPLAKPDQAAFIDKAQRLVRFIEADAKAYEVTLE